MSLITYLAFPCSSSASTVHDMSSVLPIPESDGHKGVQSIEITRTNLRECPLANLKLDPKYVSKCPFHSHRRGSYFKLKREVTLDTIKAQRLCDIDSSPNQGTAALLRNIGGGDRIREICTRFYARAFVDFQLSPFFFNFDGATRHAKRLGDWIVERMGGEGTPWVDSGRWGSREPNHRESWHNERRDVEKRGTPFKLDDTRVWMRLHFWAVRECGLGEHAAFMSWYMKFIGYFVQVYEVKAKDYVVDDANWSTNSQNISEYFANNNKMTDVIGIF